MAILPPTSQRRANNSLFGKTLRGDTQADDEIYSLIMTDKERMFPKKSRSASFSAIPRSRRLGQSKRLSDLHAEPIS